ncbi:hypothetical protein J2755_000424 [Methanohalophilus levihalophilus]|uniref:hypothetical protein n=1 Tax=Methanohalophilus levihalophilus TaxID=1431282 RepID=UPI001AE957FC|nr:hypothetical protein [Methanohalophilus levihalophilus]MBP2029504.1 hypothetical protein [Methanohalophilus levihalophilus]
MENVLKIVITILFCSLFVFTLYASDISPSMEEEVISSYNYRVDIKSGEPIYDVTLYLPVPLSEDGNVLTANDLTNIPSGWNCSIINTSEGRMLMLKAPIINPNFHGSPNENDDIDENVNLQAQTSPNNISSPFYHQGISINKNSDRELNTMNPFEGEPLLFPRYSLAKMDTRSSDEHFYVPDFSLHGYESRVYTYYRTSPRNNVEILVEISGYNQWWTSGWTGNKYTDQVTIASTGTQMGWQNARGLITSGTGNYQ